MRRRLTGIIAAVALAGLGTFALVQYVRGAEDRALAGEEVVDVLVVDTPIVAGTPSDELADRLRVEQVPVKLRAADALADLGAADGLVTSVDLVPGEQLVLTRMVRPEDVAVGAASQVPPGMVEVTVELSPTRALGGLLRPGDTVAVLSSFDPFDLEGAVIQVDGEEVPVPTGTQVEVSGKTPNSTHIIVHKVLVTAVQTAATEAVEGEEEGATIPDGNLLVTLAVTPPDAERVVFTAEFGKLWLAGQGVDVPEGGTQVQTRGTVYAPAPGNVQ